MSDEDEMEKFEITDYDLDNEFNMYRNRKGLSKQQQIYGIWADEEDSDNEGERKYNRRGTKKPQSYSAPIGFVAGGVQQAGKKKIEPDTKSKPTNSEPDEDNDNSPKIANSSDSEESESELQSHRGGLGMGGGSKSTVTEITGDIAGLRNKTHYTTSLMNQGVGNWEKHTKGIGAKLLLQMGFQPGKGLGKDLQGISAPVEAHLRKGRGAIGAYGPEKPASVPKLKETVKTEDGEATPSESKWRKNDTKSSKKTRYYYRSVDDVIEKGKRPGAFKHLTNSSDLTKVKVIDMTGPQQRVLSGYHALSSGLKAPPGGGEHFEDVVHKKCSNFALPEIQHNLDLLVDMCEQDIIRIDRNTRNNQDKIISLKQEETTLKNALKKEEDLVENLTYVMDVVEKLLDPAQGYSLGQIAEMFRDLQEQHFDEYCRYELAELAPGLVGPLLTSALANWSPLSQPNQYVDLFEQWRSILSTTRQSNGNDQRQLDHLRRLQFEGNNMGIQPYDSLIWHTWMPVMRTCVSNWNARDCDSLITLIETWIHLLPPWIQDNIYDHLIIPRLLSEVTEWNPLTDTVPIHLWIHPWIPLLDMRLQQKIYPLIQEKLGTALTNWHPSDPSAKPMLKPWQRALPDGEFLAFLLKHIVPKLQVCMQSLLIHPHQQHLGPWNWVMDWSDMLNVANMTLILDKFFFPRWLQALAMWLNQNPNYNQVTEWYSGWKRMLSEDLLMQPTIKDNFHKALEMMNRAVNIGQQPGAKESISYLASLESNSSAQSQQSSSASAPPPPRVESIAEAVRTASKIPQGFKDLVTKRCEERGILFVPIVNKYHESKQVYRIGNNGVQCFIDRNVIFYSQNNSTWIPTSLNRLLDMA